MEEKNQAKNLMNQKFGKLTVKKRNGSNKQGRALWLCNCECGNKDIEVVGKYLLNGDTKSCGCIKKSEGKQQGKSNTRLYKIWYQMKERCYNKTHMHYDKYGGRGNTICEEWLDEKNGFFNFEKWAIEIGYYNHVNTYGEVNTTLDRNNVNGNYEPSNYTWETVEIQSNNKTNNRFITIDGITKTLSQWSRETGINFTTLHRRLDNNWSKDELFKPVTRIEKPESGVKGVIWDSKGKGSWEVYHKGKYIGRNKNLQKAIELKKSQI